MQLRRLAQESVAHASWRCEALLRPHGGGLLPTDRGEELPEVPPILKAVFADRARRGRSCDPEASWRLLKIKMRPYLVILRHHGWSYVYAPDGGSEFSRYAYDPEQDRWSFGQAPVHRAAVLDWMRTEWSAAG